ncbi:MAG: hypothetical protein ACK5AM_13175, partial [Pirellulaceae bacterium]
LILAAWISPDNGTQIASQFRSEPSIAKWWMVLNEGGAWVSTAWRQWLREEGGYKRRWLRGSGGYMM